MQYRPDATELLGDIASLLEDDVLPAVPPALQHRVRVAGHLARLVERELRLGPAAAEAERARWAELLRDDVSSLPELRRRLVERFEDPRPFTDEEERAIYEALLATVRDDLAIAKPGYDQAVVG